MKKYLIILVCVFLCSCVSTKKVRNQSLEVAKFDIEKFNGSYANYADTTNFGVLFSKLYPENIFHNNKFYPTQNAIINLKFDGKKTLIITTIDNNIIFKETKLKGKIKNNYFSLRRKLFLLPIPFFYFHKEAKILLGNDKDGNLIVKSGEFGLGWFTFMMGSNKDISQSQFKKLN